MKCACGCGRTTNLVQRTATARGVVKGEYRKYWKGHHRRTETDGQRLAKRLRAEPNGCIVFIGSAKRGYGVFRVNEGGRRSMAAHRAAWLLAGHTIPKDKPFLLHSCDNPSCCNTAHLRPGTAAENASDMARRGRGRKGSLPFGVTSKKGNSGFGARVVSQNKARHLGTFQTIEQAHAVALAAKERIYGSDL